MWRYFCLLLIANFATSITHNKSYSGITLTNNDILRRIRYTFNFNDNKMIAIFALADHEVTREQVSYWLKKEDDPTHINCTDTQLAIFLNGLINEKRGKKDGPQHAPEKRMTNNIVLNKLKIAFNLKAEDILELLAKSDLSISKHELSAFFRKPNHQHFRQCKDQILRNFLQGLDEKYHVERSEKYIKDKSSAPEKFVSEEKEEISKNYKTANPKASKIYHNPKATSVEKSKPERKVLKLKPKDIWGE